MFRYFNISEFTNSQTAKANSINNWPSDTVAFNNTVYLGYYLDYIRDCYGHPIVINSGYRCKELNKLVGGVQNSKHIAGLAVDISILHTTDYGKLYKLLAENARYISINHNKHYIHVDYSRDFLYNFYKTHVYEK